MNVFFILLLLQVICSLLKSAGHHNNIFTSMSVRVSLPMHHCVMCNSLCSTFHLFSPHVNFLLVTFFFLILSMQRNKWYKEYALSIRIFHPFSRPSHSFHYIFTSASVFVAWLAVVGCNLLCKKSAAGVRSSFVVLISFVLFFTLHWI